MVTTAAFSTDPEATFDPMTQTSPPAVAMKQRLRADLGGALRDKDRPLATVLRGLIARLDNAEAPPLDPEAPGYSERRSGDPDVEVRRRELSAAEVEALLRRERDERLAGSAELVRLGRADAARALVEEAQLIEPYLASAEDPAR